MAWVVATIVAIPVALIVLLLLLLQFDGVSTRLVNRVLDRVAPWPGVTATVGQVGLSGLRHLVLYDLQVGAPGSDPMVEVDTLDARFRLLPMLRGEYVFPSLSLAGVRVVMTQRADSSWDLLAPFLDAPTDSSTLAITLGRAELRRGSLQARYLAAGDSVLRVRDLTLRLDTLAWPQPLAVGLDTVDAWIAPPGQPNSWAHLAGAFRLQRGIFRTDGVRLVSDSSDVHARGSLALPDSGETARDIDFTLRASPLHLQDVSALFPAVGATGSLVLDARLTGSSSTLGVQVDGTTSDGAELHLTGEVTPRTHDALRFALQGWVRDIDPTRWAASAPPVRGIDAEVELALTGPRLDSLSGSARLEISEAQVADGTLERAELSATFRDGEATFDLSGGIAPWGRLIAHGVARPLDSLPAWDVRATLSQLDPVDAGAVRVASAVARIRASGSGVSPATMQGRARVTLNGQVGTAVVDDAILTAAWRDAGANVALDLPLGSGRVSARARTEWGGAAPVVTVRSLDVDQLQVAELLGDSIAGTISLRGSGAATLGEPERTVVEADLVIERATWRGYEADSGAMTIRLRGGRLDARGRLVAPAGIVRVAAGGRPFDDVPSWSVDSLRIVGLNLASVDSGYPQSDLHALLRLEGRGLVPDDMRATGALIVSASEVAGVPLDTASVEFTARDGAIDLSGAGRTLGGSWSLAAEARPLDVTPTIRITRARFDSIRIDSTLAGPIQATLTGTLVADAALPSDTFPTLTARLALESGRLNGEPIDSGMIEARLEGDSAWATAALAVAGGQVDVRARAALLWDSLGISVDGVRGSGQVDLPRLAKLLGRDSLPSELHARVAFGGSGTDLRTMDWDIDASASGHFGAASLDSLAVDARLDRGILRLDTLVVASNFLRGGAGGWLPLFDSLAVADSSVASGISLQLRADSVSVLADVLGVRPLATRGGALRATATWREGAIHVDGVVDAGGMIGPALAADTLHADFAGVVRDGRVTGVDVDLLGEQLSVASTILRRVEGRVSYDSSGATFTGRAAFDDQHEVRVAGTTTLSDSTLQLDSLSVDLPSRDWRLAEPVTLRWGDRLDPGGLTLVSEGSRIALNGLLDLNGSQTLAVQLDSVQVGEFAELAGIQGLEGVVSARLDVSGPADDVTLNGTVEARIGGTVATLAMRPADGPRVGVDLQLIDADGDSLRAVGTIPFQYSLASDSAFTTSGDVALALSARDFSLGWITPLLNPLGVERLEGELSADARLDGTLDAPLLTGTAALARGTVLAPMEGVAYRDLHGEFEFSGDRLRIASLAATSEGTVEITGDVIMAPLSNPQFDLAVRLRRFEAVDNEWTRLRATGNLTVTGDLAAPEVDGSVRLEATDFYLDELESEVTATPVELTPADYQMLEAYFGYTPRARRDAEVDPLLAWQLGVRVEIGNDVWVRQRTQPEMRVQLNGSLDVRKQAGDSIQLFGTLEALSSRSYFEQFGRRFSVVNGTVTFNGPLTGWRVAASARYEVPSSRDPSAPEAVITLDVTGGEDDLRLTLGSQPSMENADIISYLATGRPAASAAQFGNTGGESGSGGGILSAGGEFALGRVATALEETAQETIGLDVVEIRQNGLEGATLVSGRYVNPRLFIGFQQPLTFNSGSDATRPDQGFRGTLVELEYTWYRWLSVHVLGGQSALRFFLRSRYAY